MTQLSDALILLQASDSFVENIIEHSKSEKDAVEFEFKIKWTALLASG